MSTAPAEAIAPAGKSWRSSPINIGIACFIGMMFSSAAVLSVNPLLLTPTIDEFGWGRATYSSAQLVSSPVMALMFLLVGPALDRFGAKRLLQLGFVLFGAATALLSQLNGSIPQLLALKVLVIACASLPTGVAFGKIIANHFSERRGTMLGLCLGGGGGLGMMVMPIIGAQVLEAEGWRATYVAVGMIGLVVGLAATMLLPNDRPPARSDTHFSAPLLPGLTGREAMVTSPFLLLAAGAFLSCMVLNGTLAHLGAIMSDAGMAPSEAALALSVYAFAMICGQFGIGLLLDRISTPKIFIPVLCLALAGIAMLYFGSGKLAAVVGAACIGAAAGSEYSLLPYMLTRYFGLRSFGQLYGLIYSASALGTGLGPVTMGGAFDMTGSYDNALAIFAAALVAVIVLFVWLRPYSFTASGEPVGR